MRALVILCGLACGLTPALCGQEPAPTPLATPPTQPFLEKAPEFAQWTVVSRNVETPPDKSPPPEASPGSPSPAPGNARSRRSGKSLTKSPEPAPTSSELSASTPAPTGSPTSSPAEDRRIFVIKTKTIRHERTTAKGEDDIERWCLPGIQITVQKGGTPTVSLPSDAQNSDHFDYSQTDFAGFDWLSPSNFEGIEQVNDQQCYVFHERAKKQRGNPDGFFNRVACINMDTRLPVTLQEDDELSTYHFDVAPTSMLKPPPDVMAKVEEWRKSVQQAELMPAKP